VIHAVNQNHHLNMNEYIGYFDDSGHPDKADIVLIAGWLSTKNQWVLFENEWKQALISAGIPAHTAFHMTDFESPDHPFYSTWSRFKKDLLLFRLINILRTRTRMFFSALVPMKEYRLVNDRIAIEECLGRPYAMAGRLIGQQLRYWQQKYSRHDEPLVMVFEDGSKHKGDLMDIFRRDGFGCPTFRGKNKSIPLQGADLLAWEYYHSFKCNLVRPSLDSIVENHPGIDNIYTYDDLLESAKEGNVPWRDNSPNSFFFHNLKKKIRRRTIF
jgi:hypothetical protein